MAITLTASQVPVPTGPTAGVSIADCTDSTTTNPVATAFATGAAPGLAEDLNEVLARIANACLFGGNGYGVVSGFTLSDGGGLTLDVAAGIAMIGDTVAYAGGTYTVPDNTARVYIWLKQDGTLTHETTTAVPAGGKVFLGSLVTNAGAITSLDESGICYLRNGLLIRITADTTRPTDSPGSSTCFLTRGVHQIWFWDGARYRGMAFTGRKAVPITDGADTTATAAQYETRHIECTGALTAGRNLILPLIDGGEWVIANNTTGGFAVTAKGATGTGIAIAATKTAIVRCDGTNFLRVTADV